MLTPATAVRYEKHDRKVRQMTKEEELGVRRGGRRVDMRDEYYVSGWEKRSWDKIANVVQRLAGRDIDNWEQKRVERFKGESDGILR